MTDKEVMQQALEAWGNPRGMKDLCVAMDALRKALEQPEQEPVSRYCCHSCFKVSGGVMLDRMILCSECGNKRCPKATDHNFSCTGSNDLGQWGSIYGTPPAAQPEQGPVAWQHRKPVCDSHGKTLGYTDWKDGKGLGWWPHRAFYTTPPAAQRPWVGLTDEELEVMFEKYGQKTGVLVGALWAEAKLKERNT